VARAVRLLLADIGGTHTRLCITEPDADFTSIQAFANAGFKTLESLLLHYLKEQNADPGSLTGRFGVACPVTDDVIELTNFHWVFSVSELSARLGLRELNVVNDFTAIALSVPHLQPTHLEPIASGVAQAHAAIAVLGPGTGLGVSALIPHADGWAVLPSEGGHATLAASSDEESRILTQLRQRVGHVSAEKVLAGPGLMGLYCAIAETEGRRVQAKSPEQITSAALSASDPLAQKTVDHYLAMLGGFAGDLALTLGARGGVYLAGGIMPSMISGIRGSRFTQRFADKGLFRTYLEAIPIHVITHPCPALLGLQHQAISPGCGAV